MVVTVLKWKADGSDAKAECCVSGHKTEVSVERRMVHLSLDNGNLTVLITVALERWREMNKAIEYQATRNAL